MYIHKTIPRPTLVGRAPVIQTQKQQRQKTVEEATDENTNSPKRTAELSYTERKVALFATNGDKGTPRKVFQKSRFRLGSVWIKTFLHTSSVGTQKRSIVNSKKKQYKRPQKSATTKSPAQYPHPASRHTISSGMFVTAASSSTASSRTTTEVLPDSEHVAEKNKILSQYLQLDI